SCGVGIVCVGAAPVCAWDTVLQATSATTAIIRMVFIAHPADLTLKSACPPSDSSGYKPICAPILVSTALGTNHAIIAIPFSLSSGTRTQVHDEADLQSPQRPYWTTLLLNVPT